MGFVLQTVCEGVIRCHHDGISTVEERALQDFVACFLSDLFFPVDHGSLNGKPQKEDERSAEKLTGGLCFFFPRL